MTIPIGFGSLQENIFLSTFGHFWPIYIKSPNMLYFVCLCGLCKFAFFSIWGHMSGIPKGVRIFFLTKKRRKPNKTHVLSWVWSPTSDLDPYRKIYTWPLLATQTKITKYGARWRQNCCQLVFFNISKAHQGREKSKNLIFEIWPFLGVKSSGEHDRKIFRFFRGRKTVRKSIFSTLDFFATQDFNGFWESVSQRLAIISKLGFSKK